MHSALTVRGSATYGPRAEQCCSSPPRGVLAARVARAARAPEGRAAQRRRLCSVFGSSGWPKRRSLWVAAGRRAGRSAAGAGAGRRGCASTRTAKGITALLQYPGSTNPMKTVDRVAFVCQGVTAVPGISGDRRAERALAPVEDVVSTLAGPRLAGAAGRVRSRRLGAHLGMGGRAPPRG